MNILLLLGEHDTGKTWFSRRLKELLPDQVHIVESYTSRKEREDDKKYGSDHRFTDKETIETFIEAMPREIVAFTVKDGEYYISFEDQFVDDKLNVYTVDDWGAEQAKLWAFNNNYDINAMKFGKQSDGDTVFMPFVEMDSETQEQFAKAIIIKCDLAHKLKNKLFDELKEKGVFK